ncbi:MAG TPA: MFS transporter [Rhizobiaceae bacterium]|nr:MFS transporter [Rhizobiaceae bacterium]
MGDKAERVDWRALWASGDLARFCFISLGILLHATNETMIATIMPGMVADIRGVELVGWSLSIYEIGSIAAGASAGRLVSYMALRTNMVLAALIYAAGALVCATAPDMKIFLAGRLLEGFGGGALVSLSYVSIERLFPRTIWPQLFAITSAVWGVAAFSGPLIGAVISEIASWRWAFGVFAIAGAVMASLSFAVLRGPQATTRKPTEDGILPPFPFLALTCLALAIVAIALAGVGFGVAGSTLLLVLGIAGIGGFFLLDAARPRSRLFPTRPLDLRTQVGNGIVMMAAFSLGTISFSIYGPLILTSLHGVSVLTTGYIIAAESIAWSVLSIMVANAKPIHERPIILAGSLMIFAGMVGFVWAVPAGNLGFILACAILQGGGFGIAWPFVIRVIVSSAAENERTVTSSAVPTMQRIGYAVGAAVAGIIANAAGFSDGLSGETARGVAQWLFLAFIPFGVLGCIAAYRLLEGERSRMSR